MADDNDALTRAATNLIDEARAQIAAGRSPAVEPRLRALFETARERDPAQAAAIDRLERRARRRLEHVLSVHRARTLLVRTPAPPAAAPRRAAFRARPTITGNMDVRRETSEGRLALAWDAVPAVASWDVRIGERYEARGAYAVRATVALPGSATTVEVPLADATLQIHLLGRGRDGRLLRRAVIAGLRRDNWDERWQRRASAS